MGTIPDGFLDFGVVMTRQCVDRWSDDGLSGFT